MAYINLWLVISISFSNSLTYNIILVFEFIYSFDYINNNNNPPLLTTLFFIIEMTFIYLNLLKLLDVMFGHNMKNIAIIFGVILS